jgi:hypothetical protein
LLFTLGLAAAILAKAFGKSPAAATPLGGAPTLTFLTVFFAGITAYR